MAWLSNPVTGTFLVHFQLATTSSTYTASHKCVPSPFFESIELKGAVHTGKRNAINMSAMACFFGHVRIFNMPRRDDESYSVFVGHYWHTQAVKTHCLSPSICQARP